MLTPPQLAALHLASFSVAPRLFAAPGRVNLIGEHTDYCDGFVMPAAIDFSTVVAISPRADGRVLAHSVNFNQSIDKSVYELLDAGIASLRADRKLHWSDYPAGVLWSLREALPQHAASIAAGFSLTIAGDVPLGAGLSSSASIEVATAFAVLGVLNITLPLPQIAQLCRRAENAFVGANVGIMDQFVSCCGVQDHAVMIDCRSLDYTLAPIPSQARIVICNSMVKHSVAGGEYNTRRAEIEEGTAILRSHRPEIGALRDATVDDLARWGHEMPTNVLRRCRHVITEDNRVLAAVEAFRAADLTRFGQLMAEAHASFRDDFEASCPEIDTLVSLAVQQPGCYGARITGGGFGGCTVNLVAANRVPAFVDAMRAGYLATTGITAEIYTSRASAGAHEIFP
ncbi:MAG TPA: galactokinase [Acidobacteriaceae bacterium]